MKKTKIIMAVCLVAVMLLALASCGTTFSTKTYNEEATPVLSTLVELTDYADYNVMDNDAQLVFLRKYNDGLYSSIVYNLATKTTYGPFADTTTADKTVQYYVTLHKYQPNFNEEIAFFSVVEYTQQESGAEGYVYTLYNANGEKVKIITEDEAIFDIFDMDKDLILFEKFIYRIDNEGNMSFVKELNGLTAGIPDIDGKNGEDYYNIDNDRLFVYNSNLELKYYYSLPSVAADMEIFPIAENKYLLQYTIEKFDTDNDYDVIMKDGNVVKKYDLVQKVIDAKKGKVKDVKLDAIVDIVVTDQGMPDVFAGFDKNIKAVAIVRPIVDKLAARQGDNKYRVIDGNGKLGATINDVVAGESDFRIVANDRVLHITNDGGQYLYNFKNKFIGDVSGVDFFDFTAKYIVTDTAIFDYDLKEVYDYEAAGYLYVGTIGDALVFQKTENEVLSNYIYDGEFKKIDADAGHIDVQENYYRIEVEVNDTESRYDYYNAQMQKIGSITCSNDIDYNEVQEYKGNVMLRVNDNANNAVKYVVLG